MSLTSTLPAAARGDASARHYHAGFWLVAAAFVFLTAFGTTPSPLWPLYAVRAHLDARPSRPQPAAACAPALPSCWD
jgi:hypothetical protein